MLSLPLPARVVLRAVPSGDRDEVAGDLLEVHGRRARRMPKPLAWLVTSVEAALLTGALLVRGYAPGLRPDLRAWGTDGSRVFRRAPGYASVVVSTLGTGLATTVMVFTVVRGVLLRDLPYPEADRLVRLDRIYEGRPDPGGAVSHPDLLDWQAGISSLDGIAAHTGFEGVYVADGVAEVWTGRAVTANLLTVLGTPPVLGPGFDETTGRVGAHAIMISHRVWQDRFAADPGIVGRTIDMAGEGWQVVGVLPAGFEYPDPGVDFLVPLRELGFLSQRGAGFLETIARLAPGVSLEAAREEAESVVERIDEASSTRVRGIALRPYLDVEVEGVRRILLLFLGAVLLVLTVTCANVAGLSLARTEARRQELAVRASLGAGRPRLARQVLAESLALALVGGLLGLGLAWWGLPALMALAPADLPRRSAIQVDPQVLLFALTGALVAGTACGLVPAVRASSVSVSHAGRRTTGTRGRRRAQELLTTAQIAIAVTLLVGAGLLLRSFAALTAVDPGFQADRVAVVELGLNADEFGDADATLAFHQALFERIGALSGVEHVGLSTHLPFSRSRMRVAVARDGETFDGDVAPRLGLEVFNGAYLDALGLTVQGSLPEVGTGAQPRQAVVNESAARALWPGESPIGKRFSFDVEQGMTSPPETFFTVVGTVPDVLKQALDEGPEPLGYLYLPDFSRDFSFVSGRHFYVAASSGSGPPPSVSSIRGAVAALDPELPLRSAGTLEGLVRATTVGARFRTVVLAAFAGLAILVALLGVYGTMAYGVSRRVREIGVRMALGASGSTERRRVLKQAARVAAVGAAGGGLGALLLGNILDGVLFAVGPRDPVTILAVLLLVVLGSLLASYLPAARASRVQPMTVLREE